MKRKATTTKGGVKRRKRATIKDLDAKGVRGARAIRGGQKYMQVKMTDVIIT